MRRARALVSASILLAFVAWLIWYVSGHAADFRPILEIPVGSVVLLVVVFLAIMACNALFTRTVMVAFGVRLSGRESLALALVSAFLNTVLPFRGGAGFRATYLRSAYRFAFTDFLATLSALYLMTCVVNGVLAILAMILLADAGQPFPRLLGLALVVMTVGALALITVRVRVPRWQRTPGRQLARMLAGWEILRMNRTVVLRLLLLTAAFTLFTLLQYRIAFAAVGVDLSWPETAFFVAGRNVAMMLTITPGSLGIAEALAIYMGHALDFSAAQALLVQALIRVVALLVLCTAFPLAAHWIGVDLRAARRAGAEADEPPARAQR